MFAAALLLAAITSQAETSRQLTASAEELLRIEKRIASENDLDFLLYEDVLSLLDSAIDADPDNMHAHALAAGVLLLRSDDGDGTFDICYLLDARDEANEVVAHGSRAGAADIAAARAVLREIARIPPSAIPDQPSSCDDHEEQQRGTRTRLQTR